MGNFVFNQAVGKVLAYHDRVKNGDPSTARLLIVLLKTVEADALMRDRDTLSAVLGASTEADFTNYVRITLEAADLSASTVDDTNNRGLGDFADQSYPTAGGVTNNDLAKALVVYDPDPGTSTDATRIPLTAHDFVKTTNGGPLNLLVDADGYAEAEAA